MSPNSSLDILRSIHLREAFSGFINQLLAYREHNYHILVILRQSILSTPLDKCTGLFLVTSSQPFLLHGNQSPHVKESKRVVDSGFPRLDSGFHAYGFRIPNFLRLRISKFLTLVNSGHSYFKGQYFAI